MNLKDSSIGIKAASIEDSVFPLMKFSNLLLQLLVYVLKSRKAERERTKGFMVMSNIKARGCNSHMYQCSVLQRVGIV